MFITCIIALIGAWIGKKLRIPSGIMIGAIIAVSIVNICFGVAPVPHTMKMATQIVAGAFVGASLDQKSVQKLRTLVKPAIILVVTMVTANFLLGLLLYSISPLDFCTAMFCTVPGGLAEMTMVSEDLGANTPMVSMFQLARVVLINCLFPISISCILKAEKAPETTDAETQKKGKTKTLNAREWTEFIITMLFASLAGIAGKRLGVPGGALLFSAVITGFIKVCFHIGIVPKWAKRLAQALVGAYVGAQVTGSVAAAVAGLWPYVLVIVFFYLIFCLLTAWCIAKTSSVDIVTAAFSCAPAGASEMALIASEFDVDSSTIAALQMIRLVMVIAVCPNMIMLLTTFL